ncbi:MAG: DUF4280 domain-containing protein [Holosporaceae bacterium]|jgi:hypothetical protein|nr:DUF4280 domain-containing protein [Holosporaceae bacterium]
MGLGVCTGAMSMCPFGAAPGTLSFLPTNMIMGSAGPMGTCMDTVPFLNIAPFGVCMSMANPTTASLTAAALGVLTPGPCIPTPGGTWIPTNPMVMAAAGPMLTSDSMLICSFGGVIKINVPGQFTVMI